MRKHPTWSASLWFLAAIAASGCGRAAPDGTTAATTPAPAQPASAPLSDEECQEFAEALAEAVESGDLVAFNKLVDWDAIFQTMAAGLQMPGDFRAGLFTGIRKTIDDPERGIGGQILRGVKNGGDFAFLRTRQSHGRQVVLVRMIPPGESGGVNYFEFAPRRAPGGPVRAADIYIYLAGEFTSETLRRALLPIIAERSRSFLDKLIAGEQDYVHDFPEAGRAGFLVAEGKGAEALAIYKKLRPGTRKQKSVLLGRLGAAQAAGDDKEYAEVIEEFRKNYPNDPALDMISIDGHIMRKEYDEALKAVDRLDQSVGGDAYLDTIRADIVQARGDLEGARRLARRAVEKDPALLVAHWTLVGLALEAKDFQETLRGLKEIDRLFSPDFGDLTQVPAYAEFVKSPQYREWLDYLKNKAPDETEDDARPAPKPGGPASPKPDRPGAPKPGPND